MAVTRLSSEAARLAIYYKKFNNVPTPIYDRIIALVNYQFAFVNTTQSIECDTVRKIINGDWKRRKYTLEKKYVKARPAPTGIPIEDCRTSVNFFLTRKRKRLFRVLMVETRDH